MAVLPMRLNKDALSDLVILKGGGAAPLTISSSAVVSTFVVNSTGNDSDANTGDGKCETVLNNGICTLRAAIQQANASAGDDAITFSVSSITIASGASILPTIFQPVTLDGGAGRVVISGSGLGVSASNCTIRGLVINRYPFSGGPAIGISGSSNFIEGNYIGTDVTGANADFGSSTGWQGVSVSGPLNVIGGTAVFAANVISAPGAGIITIDSQGTKVQGNYIGTDASGTKSLGGQSGVVINRDNNAIIGGTEARAGNVISGHSSSGVQLGSSAGLLVQGNLIGTNSDGSAAVTGTLTQNGVIIVRGSGGVETDATVGGTTPAARNVISGVSSFGVSLDDVSGILIQGNYIGIDKSDTKALSNGIDVRIDSGAPGNVIGGTTAGARNVIAGDTPSPLLFISDSENMVLGNYIGTNSDGTLARGRTGDSNIFINGNNNKIGGTETGAGNKIAFSSNEGVRIAAGTGNSVRRNSIFENRLGITSSSNFQPTLTFSGGALKATLSGAPPNTPFTVEFFSNPTCDPNALGVVNGGKIYLGDATKTTDASGNASFDGPIAQNVTATASAPGINTSRFSKCITGIPPPPTPTPTPTPARISLSATQLNFSANQHHALPTASRCLHLRVDHGPHYAVNESMPAPFNTHRCVPFFHAACAAQTVRRRGVSLWPIVALPSSRPQRILRLRRWQCTGHDTAQRAARRAPSANPHCGGTEPCAG